MDHRVQTLPESTQHLHYSRPSGKSLHQPGPLPQRELPHHSVSEETASDSTPARAQSSQALLTCSAAATELLSPRGSYCTKGCQWSISTVARADCIPPEGATDTTCQWRLQQPSVVKQIAVSALHHAATALHDCSHRAAITIPHIKQSTNHLHLSTQSFSTTSLSSNKPSRPQQHLKVTQKTNFHHVILQKATVLLTAKGHDFDCQHLRRRRH